MLGFSGEESEGVTPSPLQPTLTPFHPFNCCEEGLDVIISRKFSELVLGISSGVGEEDCRDRDLGLQMMKPGDPLTPMIRVWCRTVRINKAWLTGSILTHLL